MEPKNPYRENVRTDRMNRKLDFILYVNPLVRLAFVVGLALPFVAIFVDDSLKLPIAFSQAHGLMWNASLARKASGLAALSTCVIYLTSAAIVGTYFMSTIFDRFKQPRRFHLASVWWPAALVWFLVSWIFFGRILKGRE